MKRNKPRTYRWDSLQYAADLPLVLVSFDTVVHRSFSFLRRASASIPPVSYSSVVLDPRRVSTQPTVAFLPTLNLCKGEIVIFVESWEFFKQSVSAYRIWFWNEMSVKVNKLEALYGPVEHTKTRFCVLQATNGFYSWNSRKRVY